MAKESSKARVELWSDFHHDLWVFLEQLERNGLLPETLSNGQKEFIDKLLDETTDFLMESLDGYDKADL